MLIALLWVASFCVSIYVSWIPGPAERCLVGCWTTAFQREGFSEVQVLMELQKVRFFTTWFWNHEDSQWEHFGNTGRWSFDGNEFEVRVVDAGDRELEEMIESIFVRGRRARLVVVDADVDHLVLRLPDSEKSIEWTRVSEDSVPELRH